MPREATEMERRKLIGDVVAGLLQENVEVRTDYAEDSGMVSIIQDGRSVLWVHVAAGGDVEFGIPNR